MTIAKLRDSIHHGYERLKIDKPLAVKIALTALSALSFFTLQCPIGLLLSCKITVIMVSLTYVFEKMHLRDQNTQINWGNLSYNIACKVTLVVALFYLSHVIKAAAFMDFIKQDFVQKISEKVSQLDLHTVSLSLFVAPFSEEILFRGFFQERLHDLLELSSRYIYPLSSEFKLGASEAISALVFGILHSLGSQVEGIRNKAIVFFDISMMGYFCSLLKQSHKNLIVPVLFHGFNNFIAVCLIVLNKSRSKTV